MLLDWLQAAEPLFDKKTLFDGLVGALAGGVISAIMTIHFETKRSRTEISLRFLEQFMEQYDELAQVKGLMGDPTALSQPANLNKVRKFGDWCEIVSAACLAKVADNSLLDKVGIPAEIKEFHRSATVASTGVSLLLSAIRAWPNLDTYVKETHP